MVSPELLRNSGVRSCADAFVTILHQYQRPRSALLVCVARRVDLNASFSRAQPGRPRLREPSSMARFAP